MRSKTWTCRRRVNGRPCMTTTTNRKQKCPVCGGPKPSRSRPKHLIALQLPYEHYVELNGGNDRCAICLRPRSEKDRRLQRDHDHRTGRPRGLLCVRCNRALPAWVTSEWLDAAAVYLRERVV